VAGQGVIHHADRFPVEATACGGDGPAARNWRNVTCAGCLAYHPQDQGSTLIGPGTVPVIARGLVAELRRYVREQPSLTANVAVEVGQLWTWWARWNRDRGAPGAVESATLEAAAEYAAAAGLVDVLRVTGYAWVNEVQIRLQTPTRAAA
jgi:hypothetical protein